MSAKTSFQESLQTILLRGDFEPETLTSPSCMRVSFELFAGMFCTKGYIAHVLSFSDIYEILW